MNRTGKGWFVKKLPTEQEFSIAAQYCISGQSLKEFGQSVSLDHREIKAILVRTGTPVIPAHRRSVYKMNPHLFDAIEDERSAYWLGFIYADGNVSGTMLTMAMSRRDKEHLIRMNTYLESEYPVSDRLHQLKGKHFEMTTLHISNYVLAARLVDLGIVAQRGHFEKALQNVPEHLVHHFTRGFFDGDGCARKGRPELIFCGQVDMLDWLRQHLANTLETKVTKKIFAHQQGGIQYLTYGGRFQVRRVADWMYRDATVWLDRKRSIIDGYC